MSVSRRSSALDLRTIQFVSNFLVLTCSKPFEQQYYSKGHGPKGPKPERPKSHLGWHMAVTCGRGMSQGHTPGAGSRSERFI